MKAFRFNLSTTIILQARMKPSDFSRSSIWGESITSLQIFLGATSCSTGKFGILETLVRLRWLTTTLNGSTGCWSIAREAEKKWPSCYSKSEGILALCLLKEMKFMLRRITTGREVFCWAWGKIISCSHLCPSTSPSGPTRTREAKTAPKKRTKSHGSRSMKPSGCRARTNSTSRCLPTPSSTSPATPFPAKSSGKQKQFIKSVCHLFPSSPIWASNSSRPTSRNYSSRVWKN